jgi:hypothetical protein
MVVRVSARLTLNSFNGLCMNRGWAARRYRVVFTVHRSNNPADYLVTHSSAIYVFGQNGQAQFLISGLGISQHPDIAGITDDLRQLILHPPRRTLLERLASLA